ncbi:hypothetical protein TNCV_1124391 [Trichonephila clavipes]|uniref:Uncharacterized protein n=1 Tax=Trichonephila clavipes TaxID=2585209 RepID=A0A8X6SKT7_TRICX|nr:hypothetical protein TNCV_1124391 [Trichonephila clavipes]
MSPLKRPENVCDRYSTHSISTTIYLKYNGFLFPQPNIISLHQKYFTYFVKNSPLEDPPLDRKEFFAFSRISWYKSLPRNLSPDKRCTRVLMAQFQIPLYGSIPGVICVLIPSIGISPVYVQQVGYGDTDPCIW